MRARKNESAIVRVNEVTAEVFTIPSGNLPLFDEEILPLILLMLSRLSPGRVKTIQFETHSQTFQEMARLEIA